MKDDTKLFYDLTAKETADQWYGIQLLKPSIDDFIRLLPANPRILDLGCGPGHETMRLAATGATVVGIDYSAECIKIARERCPQCKFEVMDFRFLDDRIGNFDGVFACASLIHISQNELPSVFNNISNVLNDNGFMVVMVQDGTGVSEDKSNMEVKGRKLRRTVYCYPKEYLQEIAKSVGLEYIRDGYLASSIVEHGWKSYIFRAKKKSQIVLGQSVILDATST